MLARADQVLYVKKQARPGANTVASIARNASSLDPDSGMTPLPIQSLDFAACDVSARLRQQPAQGVEADFERP
jgi:hypothetical protein